MSTSFGLHKVKSQNSSIYHDYSLNYCWRSKDELVSDVLLWTPTYGQAKAGRPARTYIQQLCEDTGCNPEDLPEAMNDREKWREMVKDIRAGGTTWWWWWWWWWWQLKYQTLLFDTMIWPYPVLPLRARVGLGMIAANGYSAFPKLPASPSERISLK